jgi:hypothetical protein
MADRAAKLRREGRADAVVTLMRSTNVQWVLSAADLLKALDLAPDDIQAAVLRREGDPMPCRLIGCDEEIYARGQCRQHYLARWRRESDAPWARPSKSLRDG